MNNTGSVDQPLKGIRIVDFTWVRAGPWAARWLGSLGAQVIKVEWPENLDPLRRGFTDTPPGVEPSLNTSGNFNDTNANKYSITLNVRKPRGLELIKKLISISDIVVENFSSRTLDNWGIGYEVMNALNPEIIYVSQAGFGHTGRRHHFTTAGPIAQAFSGMTHLSGLPSEQPAGWGWSYLDDTGGMYMAFSALTALFNRNVTGKGQHVDLSQMIVGATLNGPALLDLTVNSRSSRRKGYPLGNRAHWPGTDMIHNYRGPIVSPHNAYRTKGGGYNDWAVIVCNSDEEWQKLVAVMGSPQWALEAKFTKNIGRLENQEEIDEHLQEWTLTKDKYQLMELCQSAGVRSMPVQSNEDRVENDLQLKHRDMYTEMEHPVLGIRKFQNAPFKLSKSPSFNWAPAPLIGQHNKEVFEGLLGISHDELISGYEDGTFWPEGLDKFTYMEEIINDLGGTDNRLSLPGIPSSVARIGRNNSYPESGPLAGLRILELSDEKGQWCGKLMGDLGADVIKVEPIGGENTRNIGPFLDDLADKDKSLYFWHYNTSKRGITLDIETEAGRNIFKQLSDTADVILETFSPGYLASIGLSYEDLKKSNPKLIMCSLTAFGQTGPWKDYLGADLLHLAAGGQMACCGYDEDDVSNAPPIAPTGGQSWHMASHYAYMAIMSALVYRTNTGIGQYIDTSVHDSCALTTEMHVMVWVYTKKIPHRQTGRHASSASTAKSQLICKDGNLVNANVAGFRLNPRQLKVLAEWMNGYGLAGDLLDDKYSDEVFIQENASHINKLAAHFFTQLTQEEVAYGGQERGFNWGAVRAPDDLIHDEHLHDRGFWVEVDHDELERKITYPGPAGIWNLTPWKISRRAPIAGEHNKEIFCNDLGLSEVEFVELKSAKII